MSGARSLLTHPVHLDAAAGAQAQPEFTGMEWYAAYDERTKADGANGRLVSMYSFAENWDSWEMHPAGSELVVCVSGKVTMHQQMADGREAMVVLGPGDYAINPPGAWHTMDVHQVATVMFVTAGYGTEHRAR